MVRKVFNVSGFDCPVCATKAERYLSKQDDVESARMDFTNNKLYITFKNDAWDCKKLAKVIGQVETDPLNISEVSNNANGKVKIFNKRMKILLVRIIAVVLISLINIFFLAKENKVKMYPYRVDKIKAEIQKSGDNSLQNIDFIIKKNIVELKEYLSKWKRY